MSNEGKIIESRIIGHKKLKWREIRDLQPVHFKSHHAAEFVEQSVIELGFAHSFSVWINPRNDITYFVDGHGRRDVLDSLTAKGYEIPEYLDCEILRAENEKEAAKLLLQIFNQRKSKILEGGLVEFAETYELGVNDLADLDLNLFVEVEEKEEENEGFRGGENNSNAKKIVFEFEQEKYDFVSKKIDTLITFLSVETKEDVIIKLLENNTN